MTSGVCLCHVGTRDDSNGLQSRSRPALVRRARARGWPSGGGRRDRARPDADTGIGKGSDAAAGNRGASQCFQPSQRPGDPRLDVYGGDARVGTLFPGPRVAPTKVSQVGVDGHGSGLEFYVCNFGGGPAPCPVVKMKDKNRNVTEVKDLTCIIYGDH